MSDVHDSRTRSYNMSQIRAKNTRPELLVRKLLFLNGFRFRLHQKSLPGSPDIVLKKYHTVIFVNGCFWHGHEGCKYFVIPKTRTEWWLNKIERNRYNDKKNADILKKMGWKVITVWECQLKSNKAISTVDKLIKKILN